jgi:hypothetical protein
VGRGREPVRKKSIELENCSSRNFRQSPFPQISLILNNQLRGLSAYLLKEKALNGPKPGPASWEEGAVLSGKVKEATG